MTKQHVTKKELDRAIRELLDARKSALMKNASFGFPRDTISVNMLHRDKEILHPDKFIKETTRLYRGSWIVGPIDRALNLLGYDTSALEIQ